MNILFLSKPTQLELDSKVLLLVLFLQMWEFSPYFYSLWMQQFSQWFTIRTCLMKDMVLVPGHFAGHFVVTSPSVLLFHLFFCMEHQQSGENGKISTFWHISNKDCLVLDQTRYLSALGHNQIKAFFKRESSSGNSKRSWTPLFFNFRRGTLCTSSLTLELPCNWEIYNPLNCWLYILYSFINTQLDNK